MQERKPLNNFAIEGPSRHESPNKVFECVYGFVESHLDVSKIGKLTSFEALQETVALLRDPANPLQSSTTEIQEFMRSLSDKLEIETRPDYIREFESALNTLRLPMQSTLPHDEAAKYLLQGIQYIGGLYQEYPPNPDVFEWIGDGVYRKVPFDEFADEADFVDLSHWKVFFSKTEPHMDTDVSWEVFWDIHKNSSAEYLEASDLPEK